MATQQGIHESYYRDMTVMFGKWEFDPMGLPEPLCPVHLWQGDEDGLVPVELQRHLAGKLGWVNYHSTTSSPAPGTSSPPSPASGTPCSGHFSGEPPQSRGSSLARYAKYRTVKRWS